VIAGSAAPSVLIPIAFPALVAAVLWDGRVALSLALVLAVLFSVQGNLGETSARILLASGGAAAALSVRVVHRRAHGLILGAVVAVAYFVAALALALMLSWNLTTFASTIAWGTVNGIGCALIAVGLMPVFEAWTGITTDQTLLELGDLNGPLLKRLSLEASGTYAHSVNVAHLAEAAARAIGANPLLARVGAYYHDIGKMAAPQYFVENQAGGRNPHDRLSPEDSVAIIRGHVLEGMRMAEQAKLPECIRSFIPEHHGTQLIGFFYEKAKDREDGAELDPAAYSYPGPNPRSRETAILLLADSVESAAKVLDDPSPESIRAMVDRIVQGKINRGQLDEAPLTFSDLARVRDAFVAVLSGMYHHRLDYPASAIGLSTTVTEPAGGSG
jgi:putative nucleotidyltransferase with HDIG domain